MPDVNIKIDGLDATVTRGMSVKGTDPQSASHGAPQTYSTLTKSIQMPSRDCEITLVAIALDGKKHASTVRLKWTGSTAQVQKEGRLLVLSIGVSKYQDKSIPELQLAAKDAGDFSALAATQKGGFYTEAIVRTLVDEDATRGNILDELDALEKSVADGDTALIFIAGHGVSDEKQFYLVPHDADDEKIRRTCVGFDEVQSCAVALKSRTLVFMDTCHSGGISSGGEISTHISALLTGWKTAKSDNGAVIFTSSTGNQLSQEKLQWQNGAFTKVLLEGLRGEANPAKAGPISASMLDSYLAKKVSELTNGLQTPTSSKTANTTDFEFFIAGDAKIEKAFLEEEAFKREALLRAADAVHQAFTAQQNLIKRNQKLKELEEFQDSSSEPKEYEEGIQSHKQEIAKLTGELNQNLATLREIANRNKYIVAGALAERQEKLSNDLKTANSRVAEIAVSAMNTIKQEFAINKSE
jgi:hypothetical protein